ncbi:MAG: hypothetical protein A3J55_02990 [Candidatus Ryanbacteria bacterium RIFCSPHIGHO2_02_FULL_45_17b]|uniref:HTH deoR-type domain-containing protein n=1 Tax=Candidatus Ryanbacteria bacterium RIFCSPHIGHO2_01_FULL_45_22 TaxID=1802114 RepID=A0A1G2G0S8_9BACT|nr:MAG: hypothetical protein A2719_05470 [Candidatus Ryanbacteria bacterium RIFCSPHIGHO2_01_FULL_45_22]OGZ47375.1 MAG: hypothetical protein A3J55_02990 [Candidatus Ryanbacteria bacterium RIFCSPHIGHO2_02_FULL_45_17b]
MSCKSQNEDISLEDRVRRATAALYRVTDTLSDNEPMKWKLRNDAVELVDSIVAVSQKEQIFSENFHYPLLIADRLVSKIGIISAGGYISKINFQVLEHEYTRISDMLFDKMSDIDKGQNILSDIYIGQHRKHIKDIKDIKIETDFTVEKDKKDSKKISNEPSSISERQKRITVALVGKGWLHVVEVANLCGGGASTKTIQRDLGSLVQSGVMQSKGERRWRTYALAESYKESTG